MSEELLGQAKSRIESMLAPINGGVGEDISYDDNFEKIKSEVEKLASLDQIKPDWGMVVTQCDELLTDKSKDFRVALYYAAARGQFDGLKGVLDGLYLCHQLTELFWEEMYPSLKRARARGNLMTWYSDVIGPAVEAVQPTARDRPMVLAVDALRKECDATWREKLGEAYGGMGTFGDACRSLVQRCPEEAPPPPPPPPPKPVAESSSGGSVAPAAAPAAAAAADQPVGFYAPAASELTDEESIFDALKECRLAITRGAAGLRVINARDVEAYRLARVGTWLMVLELPPNENGRTSIPAPGEDFGAQLEERADAANWEGVIDLGEEIAAEHMFFLDAQRHIANALEQLGEDYDECRRLVLLQTAVLVQRLNGIQDLTFEDGSAFADDATKTWIESDVLAAFGSGGGGGGGRTKSYIDVPLKEARAKLADQEPDLPGAVQIMSKAISRAPNPKERFKGQLELSKMCLAAGAFLIARAQLQGLHQLVKKHALLDWDPALCAEVYAALYEAHRAANAGGDVTEEIARQEEEVFRLLCELDAAAAMRVDEAGG